MIRITGHKLVGDRRYWTTDAGAAEALLAESPSVSERRALFVYTAGRLAAIAAGAPVVPPPWTERDEAFRREMIAAVERRCNGEQQGSPEELHNEWMERYRAMGWSYGPTYDPKSKTHPDLVPYAELDQRERDKDEVFIALCDIARRWIRG